MKLKRNWLLFVVLAVGLFSGIVSGQNKPKFVGNITIKINSNGSSKPDYVFNVPVNEKSPLRQGDGIRIEQSETGDTQQVNAVAVADKNVAGQALLKITYISAGKAAKTRKIVKSISLRKGQTRSLQIKFEGVLYKITAVYKPENK